MSDNEKTSEDDSLNILFEPFSEGEDNEDFLDGDGAANVQIRLVLYFRDDDDAPLKLAEMLIAHFREHGCSEFCVSGQLWFNHDDDSLPPSPFNYDKLPAWIRPTIDAYRKTEAKALLEELSRLRDIIAAVESRDPDSCFNDEENRHRAVVKAVQDDVFGSRETLRERLEAARAALRHYAEGADGDRARFTLSFTEEP